MPKLLWISSLPLAGILTSGTEISAKFTMEMLKKQGWSITIICHNGKTVFFPRFPKRYRFILQPILKLFNLEHFYYSSTKTGKKWVGNVNYPSSLDFTKKLIDKIQPDIVLGYAFSPEYDMKILNYSAAKGIPVICFITSVSAFKIPRYLWSKKVYYIGNSRYTSHIAQHFLKRHVPYHMPLIYPELITSPRTQPLWVLFINPIPQKGVGIFIEIAKMMPQTRFVVINNQWWHIQKNDSLNTLRKLPNITILEKMPYLKMKEIYAQTKVLLVLSAMKETFCRVIIEAHNNSIPVIARKIGAIPETLGQGGILVRRQAPPEDYVQALTRLLNDQSLYNQYSIAAYKNSQQPRFNSKINENKFMNLIEDFTKKDATD
ncbi:MAG: glycosyltransferase [Candidatus Omnitrophica bacterium]|nr:glycosyltransferase [Candidatus Omnitrophota bacterium]